MKAVLLTGYSGVGKTTLAESLSRQTGMEVFSERDISRSIAKDEGHARSRLWLATVGVGEVARAIRERTLELMTQASQSGQAGVIIDGVYDALLQQAIRQRIANAEIQIINVEAPREVRIQRYARRIGALSLELADRDMQFLDDIKVARLA